MLLDFVGVADGGATVMRNLVRQDELIKIGAKVVSHGRYVAFQMAEVVRPRQMSQELLRLIAAAATTRAGHI